MKAPNITAWPWAAHPSPRGHRISLYDSRDGTAFEPLAEVWLTEKTSSGIRFTDNRLANAKLIAAAPSLADAVNELLEGMIDGPNSTQKNVTAYAIAKCRKALLEAGYTEEN